MTALRVLSARSAVRLHATHHMGRATMSEGPARPPGGRLKGLGRHLRQARVLLLKPSYRLTERIPGNLFTPDKLGTFDVRFEYAA